MNLRRFTVAVLAIFVFALLWNGVVHLVLLRDANMALAGLVRPAAERSFLLSMLLTLAIAILFVFSYVAVGRGGGVRHGLGHGAYFGLLAGLLVDLNQYLLYPIPASLAAAWFLFGFIEFCLYGVLVGRLYPIQGHVEDALVPAKADSRLSD